MGLLGDSGSKQYSTHCVVLTYAVVKAQAKGLAYIIAQVSTL